MGRRGGGETAPQQDMLRVHCLTLAHQQNPFQKPLEFSVVLIEIGVLCSTCSSHGLSPRLPSKMLPPMHSALAPPPPLNLHCPPQLALIPVWLAVTEDTQASRTAGCTLLYPAGTRTGNLLVKHHLLNHVTSLCPVRPPRLLVRCLKSEACSINWVKGGREMEGKCMKA